MKISDLFLQRYTVLYDFWLGSIWEAVSDDLMRQRPHPQVNSIAWNLWHVSRCEDAGLNRFVADRPQILNEGAWMQVMNVPWRHHGSGMSFAEVDELNRRIDLPGLRAYSEAVRERTLELIGQIDQIDLDAVLHKDHVHRVVVDEGLGHKEVEGLIQNYTGWSKGKCLMNLGLTHAYQHVGEMGVITSLLGVSFD